MDKSNVIMALNVKTVEFLLNNIYKSNVENFSAEVYNLFEHLDDEVKDNPIYNKYQQSLAEWEDYWGRQIPFRSMPFGIDKVKSFTYWLYREVIKKGERGYSIAQNMTSGARASEAILKFNNSYLGYLKMVFEEILNANPELESNEVQKVKGNKVFIIHGHDNGLKTEVQLMLHRAGVNNIVLHEQPDGGRTIIDKLVYEASDSNFAIALLSPDDLRTDGNSIARQNVILEIGYFMGLLGKERVRLLRKGDVEVPSDLSGIIYQVYDSGGAWKIKIAKELQAVGIIVDMQTLVSVS